MIGLSQLWKENSMKLPPVCIKKILYTTNLSENARLAFAYAVYLAHKFGARITILNILTNSSDLAAGYIGEDEWQKVQAKYLPVEKAVFMGEREKAAAVREALQQFVDNARNEENLAPFAVDEIIVEKNGSPVEAIVRISEEKACDLIVMGCRETAPFTFVDSMIGSTAARVLERSKIPVFTACFPERNKRCSMMGKYWRCYPLP